MTNTTVNLLAQADQAIANKNFPIARELLQEAIKRQPDNISIFLKLAGSYRAIGQHDQALHVVNRALIIAPLDFMALLMKANILEQLHDANAGEAWGYAIAQRPKEKIPQQIEAILAHGEQIHAMWLEAREYILKKATIAVEERAGYEEQKNITRFRNNILRRTRPYHSEPTHFHFPGLVEREFHPRSYFPWLEEIEAGAEIIASELKVLLAHEQAELAPYIQYEEHLPLQQWKALNHNKDWTAIHLLQNGCRVDANARHCPNTMALLEAMPQPLIPGASPNAMFSLLAPRTHIPPHVGINNARLVCHLPLIIPENCWFRVGAETRPWKVGEAFIFDDTIEHEAMNSSDQLRVVLIFDIWHPDVSEVERDAIAAVIAADNQMGH